MRAWTWLFLGAMGCSGGGDTAVPEDSGLPSDTESDTDTDTDADADADADTDADTDADADTDTDTGTPPTGTDPAEAVCDLWATGRAGLTGGSWTGDVNTCDAGDVSADARASALQLWNLYRAMVGHGPVTTDPGKDADAQDCALIQHAAGYLTHTPDSGMDCYTASGAGAAGASNIASTDVVEAIDLYMIDPGNTTTLGHRRWLLSNGLSVVGIGGTSSYSCHTVIGGPSGGTSTDWTAWPPPGPVPMEVWTVSWDHLDRTGWSLQSDTIDLGGASVTVTRDDGAVLDMQVTELLAWYGSLHAISMIPDGWSTEAGRTYTVDVTGITPPIQYTVEPVDCASLP